MPLATVTADVLVPEPRTFWITPPNVELPPAKTSVPLAPVELLPMVWFAAVAPLPRAKASIVSDVPSRSSVPLVVLVPKVIVLVPAAVALPKPSVPCWMAMPFAYELFAAPVRKQL